MSEEFDALVITGDASNPEILKKAEIENSDALIALTGSDPLNTVIAMLGHRFEVEKIIVKLNDLSLRSACEEIGVDKIVTPKVSAAAEIFSTLFGVERENLSIIVSGGLRMVTIEVGNAKDKKVDKVEMPEGSHIVAVKRDDEVLIPRKDLTLKKDDELMLFIEERELLDELKKVLGKNGNS